MAPSSTRMRSAASARSVASFADRTPIGLRLLRRGDGMSPRLPLRSGPQSEQMTDRVDKIGAVHGVKMKIADAVVDEIEHLFSGDRGGDEFSCCRIVVETFEAAGKPVGHRCAGARREI